jgi:hypothetical protein
VQEELQEIRSAVLALQVSGRLAGRVMGGAGAQV